MSYQQQHWHSAFVDLQCTLSMVTTPWHHCWVWSVVKQTWKPLAIRGQCFSAANLVFSHAKVRPFSFDVVGKAVYFWKLMLEQMLVYFHIVWLDWCTSFCWFLRWLALVWGAYLRCYPTNWSPCVSPLCGRCVLVWRKSLPSTAQGLSPPPPLSMLVCETYTPGETSQRGLKRSVHHPKKTNPFIQLYSFSIQSLYSSYLHAQIYHFTFIFSLVSFMSCKRNLISPRPCLLQTNQYWISEADTDTHIWGFQKWDNNTVNQPHV